MNAKKVLLPVSIVAVALAAALAAGCGGKQTPVARVEVDPRLVQVPFSEARAVRLTWTPSAPLEGETPTVFVHLLDDKKKVSRTFDHPFPQRWREGAPLTDEFKVYQSALAQPLPAGKYQVVVGLYGKDRAREIRRSLDPQCLSGFRKNEKYEIEHSDVFLTVDNGDFVFLDCAYEEVLQSIGPINDTDSVPWTMFNDNVSMGFFDVYDQYILNLLYHPRIKAGMTVAEVKAVLPQVLPEVRAWVKKVNNLPE